MIEINASLFSPKAESSAICLKRSKFTFAPLKIVINSLSFIFCSATYCFNPASANAPAGSGIERVSSKISFTAAQISSTLTKRISSTSSFAIR